MTDLPLTERGERNARRLGDRLRGLRFTRILASPLQRTIRTCELAGFGKFARVEPDLLEWNYGEYEDRRSVEIHAEGPEWLLFRDGWDLVQTYISAEYSQAPRHLRRLSKVAALEKGKLEPANEKEVL